MELALKLLNGGAGSLASYLAAHVLLCLLPAFFIAGAMVALIPKASITRWLGRNTPAYVSSPAAAGVLLSLLAVLIAGTLKLWPLTVTVANVNLPLPWTAAWQAALFQWMPKE